MRVGITGTPGTGKTTAVTDVDSPRPIVHLNEVLQQDAFVSGWDDERESAIADLAALDAWLANQPENVVVESHLAHHLSVDYVIVLRCDPDTLRSRLSARYELPEDHPKVSENVEAEALDLIFSEAVTNHGIDRVTQVDTTDALPSGVATEIERIIAEETSST